jgi:hypothetical protein
VSVIEVNQVTLSELNLEEAIVVHFVVSKSERKFMGEMQGLDLFQRNEADIVQALVVAANKYNKWVSIPYCFGSLRFVPDSIYYKVVGKEVFPTAETADYPWKQ